MHSTSQSNKKPRWKSVLACAGLLCLVTIAAPGCSKDSRWGIRDRSKDYSDAQAEAGLKMPEEFRTVPHSTRYSLDTKKSAASAAATESKVND